MAKIQSNGIGLEIKFDSFKDEWIEYDIRFYWKDDIIINDNILKRTGEYWNRRGYGTFRANDYEEDYLIETIKKALNNECVCWEPMEPDARVAIYPGRFFPFLKTRYNLYEEMEEMRKERESKKSPDDIFSIIAFIDSYNFKESTAYSDEGIALHIIAERKDLEKFLSDLEVEYSEIKRKRA